VDTPKGARALKRPSQAESLLHMAQRSANFDGLHDQAQVAGIARGAYGVANFESQDGGNGRRQGEFQRKHFIPVLYYCFADSADG
jgi:hypothetical protein